jgi:mannosyltransferase
MNVRYASSIAGALLVLTGLLVPSSPLILSLRTLPTKPPEELINGAALLRIGIIILGLLVATLMPMSQPKSESVVDRTFSKLSRKSDLTILALILFAASALRLYGLNEGLWHDEVLTHVRYARMPFGEIITTYSDQNQHFLYSLLAHASFRIFGESAWSLRLPAVLFGIASIWALYLLGCQVSTHREALLSAALLALSYHHIWFSQNARGYIGLLFWTILASWLFLRGLHELQPRWWLIYAAATALGVYTNIAMVFVVVSHFIIYLYQIIAWRQRIWPRRWMGFCLGFCLAGFLTFLLYALVLPQMLGGLVGEESTVAAWKHPLWAVLEFMKAIKFGFAGGLVATAALLVFGIGLWSFARTCPTMIALLIIPSLICAVVVVGMGHHVWPRLFFFSFGFAALIVIRGTGRAGEIVTRLLNTRPLHAFPVGTALSIGLISVSALVVPRAYAPKQDFLGALNFVEAMRQPGDAIVTVGLASFTYRNFYQRDWKEVITLDDLKYICVHAKQTWLLYTFPTHANAVYPEIMATLKKDFEAVKQFPGTVGDGTIFVFRYNGAHS